MNRAAYGAHLPPLDLLTIKRFDVTPGENGSATIEGEADLPRGFTFVVSIRLTGSPEADAVTRQVSATGASRRMRERAQESKGARS